jgi:hypothetical protein
MTGAAVSGRSRLFPSLQDVGVDVPRRLRDRSVLATATRALAATSPATARRPVGRPVCPRVRRPGAGGATAAT